MKYNRKWRKGQKLTHRSALTFWDQTPSAYKGKYREILLMLCSSSSIETRLKATQRLAESGFFERQGIQKGDEPMEESGGKDKEEKA